MKIGIKDQFRYKNIEYLMSGIDIPSIFEKLGISIENRSGNQIFSYCPDHHLFTGKKPSHPKWTVNAVTGETMCFTEGRGSNLVFTVARILDCSCNDAVRFLTGVEGEIDLSKLELLSLKSRATSITSKEQGVDAPVSGLDEIENDMKSRYMSDKAYDFFVHPPEKQYPTNILRETVDRYGVFERTWGFYSKRVIIPFFIRGLLVGFCAIDLLGKKEWSRQNPDKKDDEYRKTRYPLNFKSSKFLFGFDDCEKNPDDLILVEGPREKMKLLQEGYPNSVAIMGSYLSDDHYKLISELNPKRIILMFDGDDAGVETTDRTSKKLSRNFNVMKCVVPRGKDPKNLDGNDFRRLVSGEKIIVKI